MNMNGGNAAWDAGMNMNGGCSLGCQDKIHECGNAARDVRDEHECFGNAAWNARDEHDGEDAV